MALTRKVRVHGELFWWLVSLLLAAALVCLFVREARGYDAGRALVADRVNQTRVFGG